MSDQRVLQHVAATVRADLTDQDGVATDGAGPVTVTVARADGTTVVAAAAAVDVANVVGRYTYTLTAATTATLDELRCSWFDDGVLRAVTTVDVVGRYLFTVAEARASEATLSTGGKYSDADIVRIRREVEEECEEITGRAWVPRYHRATATARSSSTLLLPHIDVRTIRSVRVYATADTYTALDADEIAELNTLSPSLAAGVLHCSWAAFAAGDTVVVEYEHGADRPPEELKRAALTRLRHRLNGQNSAIPERAESFHATGAGTYRLATAAARRTGIPDVDAVYARYSNRIPVVA